MNTKLRYLILGPKTVISILLQYIDWNSVKRSSERSSFLKIHTWNPNTTIIYYEKCINVLTNTELTSGMPLNFNNQGQRQTTKPQFYTRNNSKKCEILWTKIIKLVRPQTDELAVFRILWEMLDIWFLPSFRLFTDE